MSTRDVNWLENSVHFWKVLGSILATTNCFHENIMIWLVQVQSTRKIVLVLLPEAIREAWSDKVTTGTTLAMKGMFKVLKSQVQIHFTVTVLYKKTIVFCTSKVSREIFDIVFFFLSRDARIRWIVFGWKLFFPFRKKSCKKFMPWPKFVERNVSDRLSGGIRTRNSRSKDLHTSIELIQTLDPSWQVKWCNWTNATCCNT